MPGREIRESQASAFVCHVPLRPRDLEELHLGDLTVCSAMLRMPEPCCANRGSDQLSRRLVMLRDHFESLLNNLIIHLRLPMTLESLSSSDEPKHCEVHDLENDLPHQTLWMGWPLAAGIPLTWLQSAAVIQ